MLCFPFRTIQGVRAADWDLAKPMFTGQLKVVSIGDRCVVKIIDKKTNQDFAQCPVDAYVVVKSIVLVRHLNAMVPDSYLF